MNPADLLQELFFSAKLYYIILYHTLVSSKNIPRINLFFHILQTNIISVRNNRITLFFELIKIVHNTTTKECTSIF